MEMRRYLLDTGIIGDFLDKRGGIVERVRKERLAGNRIGTTLPIVAELYFGAENSVSRENNLTRTDLGLRELVLWPFERAAAEEYGRLATLLRRNGTPIQVIDMMTASVALTLGNCIVVSKDTDFGMVPGLTVEDWSTMPP
jgi:tRNA(fMet)-specific endonuclease VapC